MTTNCCSSSRNVRTLSTRSLKDVASSRRRNRRQSPTDKIPLRRNWCCSTSSSSRSSSSSTSARIDSCISTQRMSVMCTSSSARRSGQASWVSWSCTTTNNAHNACPSSSSTRSQILQTSFLNAFPVRPMQRGGRKEIVLTCLFCLSPC